MYCNEMSQDDLTENVAEGFGSLSWWGLNDTLITPADLRAKFASVGLDPNDVQDIRATTAIARAAREFSMGRKGKDAKRYRAEVVYKDPTRIEVQIQYHTKDENRRTSWLPHEKVSYDVQTAQWDCSGTTAEADVFRDLASKRMTFYDHVWIRSWLKDRMKSLNGFPVGPNFYTPIESRDETVKVKDLIEAIGYCKFWMIDVMNGTETFRTVSEGARTNIASSLDTMIAKLSNWEKSSRKIRDDSAAQTLADFTELRARADLYADSLRVSLDDLKGAIDTAAARAHALVDGAPAPAVGDATWVEQSAEAEAENAEVVETVVVETVVVETTVEPVIEVVTEDEVEALRAEFKAKTGKDAPAMLDDIDTLRGLVDIVSRRVY